jgi:hypothetical protein
MPSYADWHGPTWKKNKAFCCCVVFKDNESNIISKSYCGPETSLGMFLQIIGSLKTVPVV